MSKLNPRKGLGALISVCSGKGGVGKTFTSIHLAKSLAMTGHKTLLIDLDFNLANCSIQLGLSLNDDFVDYLSGKSDWKEHVISVNGLDYLSTCNGNKEIFLGEYRIQKRIIDILTQSQFEYDYIVFDTGSGLVKDQCNLMSMADIRLLVFRPEASSMTDGYSLFKILHSYYGSNNFGFIINDYDFYEQVNRAKMALTSVAEKFAQEELVFLGSVPHLVNSDKVASEINSADEFFLNISQNVVEYWMRTCALKELRTKSSGNKLTNDFAIGEY
jgi:flagellar biosynthesis protein FlhG